MAEIVVIGEMLVEFVASEIGQALDRPGFYRGPFPSGAPAILADQAALQGASVKMIGCVGKNIHGKVILDRLRESGVDISGITFSDRPTGTAMVTYQQDGGRQFVFNISDSAASQFFAESIDHNTLQGCKILHVMGSSLSAEEPRRAILKAVSLMEECGGKISFDPNVRPELVGSAATVDAMGQILEKTSILLPSRSDLSFFAGHFDEAVAVEKLFQTIPKIEMVISKRGADGAAYYDRKRSFVVQPRIVNELDPTGAGDCFGGTFLAAYLKAMSPEMCLERANLAGALAVQTIGPMEGNSNARDIDRILGLSQGITKEMDVKRPIFVQP